MIKRLAIQKTDSAFLPEAYAYKEFFEDLDVYCEFVSPGNYDPDNFDAVLLFHGFHPFWKSYPKVVVGEYHSLSTGRFSRLKDFVKRVLNVRADVNIFLNEEVRKKLWFSCGENRLYRSMGVPIGEYRVLNNLPKDYDVVYAGSYRHGLIAIIEKIAGLGLSIAVVGFDYYGNIPNISSFGKTSPADARKIIASARFGLNYTPDIFPFNIQDSTKVLEYCAAGVGVITNRYFWVDDFEKKNGAAFLDIEDLRSRSEIEEFEFKIPDISRLDWNSVIYDSGIVFSSIFKDFNSVVVNEINACESFKKK